MTDLQSIPIELLVRRRDARSYDNEEEMTRLVDSIEMGGLINPIRVRRQGERFEVIAGSHRYAACDALGWREIDCIVVEDDDLHAELAMIDENLCRVELLPSERARQTARRKAIYEELHPETKAQVAGAAGSNRAQGNATDNLSTASFAAATANATGRDARSVRRDAERGSKVAGDALDMVRGTKLDTGAYLDRLKNEPVADQAETVRRDLAAPPSLRHEPTQSRSAPKAKPEPGEAFTRFLTIADELETIGVRDILAAAGPQRSTLGQRASGLADMLDDIMRGCDR